MSICLGVSLFKFSGISFSDGDELGYANFTGRADHLRVCNIMMGLTLSSSLRGAAIVLLALTVAGVCGDCSPSASSFDFVRLSNCYAPFSVYSCLGPKQFLPMLTLIRSSLVVVLLAWHWQQD